MFVDTLRSSKISKGFNEISLIKNLSIFRGIFSEAFLIIFIMFSRQKMALNAET